MLNKKGFTIAEVVVSFSLIAVILTSIISTTMYYRDVMKGEEVVSQLMDFKNNITKIVYDDIINKKVVSADTCLGTPNCVNLVDKDNVSHVRKIIEYDENTSTNKRGVYLYYDGIKYMLPDSDLISSKYTVGNEEQIIRVCDFVGGIELSSYDGSIFKIKTSFRHKDMDVQYDLLFVILN